jgi:hypothetical protein
MAPAMLPIHATAKAATLESRATSRLTSALATLAATVEHAPTWSTRSNAHVRVFSQATCVRLVRMRRPTWSYTDRVFAAQAANCLILTSSICLSLECTYVTEQLFTPSSAGKDLTTLSGTEAQCVAACCGDADCRGVSRAATAAATDVVLCVLKSSHDAGELRATSGDFVTLLLSECKLVDCLNGGSCSDDGSGFVCDCASGFSGTTCEISKTITAR